MGVTGKFGVSSFGMAQLSTWVIAGKFKIFSGQEIVWEFKFQKAESLPAT